MYSRSGLGLTSQQVTSTIGGGLMTTGSLLAATGVGILPGAIVSAAGLLTSLIGSLFKPDLTKVEATHIVDQIELQVLKPMLASWDSLAPEQKTASTQAAYLDTFDRAWAAVQQGCGNPQLGSAGVACIADRSPGGRYPWRAYYRDPIASDPNVLPDPVSALFGGDSMLPLLIAAGLVLAVVAS